MASALLNWTPASTTGSQKVYYKLSSASTYTLFSTLSPTATTETVTGLLDNNIYDFKVENNCGGTVAFVVMSAVNIICPPFDFINSTDTTISFGFTMANAPSSIGGYVVHLLDASNVVLNSIGSLYIPGSSSTGTFTGLTPLTAYKLRITVMAGAFNKVCTLNSISTPPTPAFFVTNIDYEDDAVCSSTPVEVGVGVKDNTSGSSIYGDFTPGLWNGSNYITIGQTVAVNPIPAGDDFMVGGFRGCFGGTATTGQDAWIQLQDNAGTIIDINPAPTDLEIASIANLTGYGIAPGWHVYVRKVGKIMPFRIDNDTNPSGGGTHGTELFGFVQTGPGAKEYFANGTVGSPGGIWDIYHTNYRYNPFTAFNAGSLLIGPTNETPQGLFFGGPLPDPIFMNVGGLSYFMHSSTSFTMGERYQLFSQADLQDKNNIGIVSIDRSAQRDHPVINSVSRLSNVVTINSTWTAGSVGGPVTSSGATYEYYLTVIKDRGLLSEAVTIIPSNASWNPSYTSGPGGTMPIPLSYPVPSVSTTSNHQRTIPLPASWITLELRVIPLVNFPTTTAVEEVLYHCTPALYVI